MNPTIQTLLRLNGILLAKGFVTRQVPDMSVNDQEQEDLVRAIANGWVTISDSCLFLTDAIINEHFDLMWSSFRDAGRYEEKSTSLSNKMDRS